jgi:hypothetical protein
MDMKKKTYSKPSTSVYEIKMHSNLLVVSDLDGDNPLDWGNPLIDL